MRQAALAFVAAVDDVQEAYVVSNLESFSFCRGMDLLNHSGTFMTHGKH